jgi:hypothetical protein
MRKCEIAEFEKRVVGLTKDEISQFRNFAFSQFRRGAGVVELAALEML